MTEISPNSPTPGEDYEDLDEETRAAVERGEALYQQGKGIPLDEAFARLREKHFGRQPPAI